MEETSVLRQRKTKEDVYITDRGDILRGDEATAHLIQKHEEEKINTQKTAVKGKSKATGSDDFIGTGVKGEEKTTLVNNELMEEASVLQRKKTKEDMYITDRGDILRGEEATGQLIQKDVKEILKESGMREILEKNTQKTAVKGKSKATGSDDLIGTGVKGEKESTLVNNESPDTNKTSSECSITQCQAEESTFCKKSEVNGTKVNKKVDLEKVKMKKIESSTSATGTDVSIATAKVIGIHGQATVPCSVNVEATGLNLKAAHADITGVEGLAKLEASASATGTKISVATAGIKGVQGEANASLDAEATGLNISGVNTDVTGTRGMAKVEASASATGGDISVGKADISGIQGQASATINAEAHGFNVKAANADISGAKVTTKIGASASVTGADITVAKADITGMKAIAQAEAKASATGFEGNFATADITGVMAKVEKQAEAEVVGAEMEVVKASITGIKKGYTATAKAKAKGASLTAGNVDITGVDATVSTVATATVAAGEANLGNVRMGGYQGSRAVASAELKAGIDAGNINIGTHSTARVGVSTKVGIGNIDLSIGPPSHVLSPSLGFSLGGCGGGGGKESKTKGSRVNGPTGESNTGNHEGSVGSHSGGYPRHSSGSTGSLGEGTHANIGGHIGSHSSINTSSGDSTSYYTGGQTGSPMRDSTIRHCTGTNTESHVGGFHPSSNEIGEGSHINSRSGAVGQNGDNGSHGRHPIGDNTETGTSTRGRNEGIDKRSNGISEAVHTHFRGGGGVHVGSNIGSHIGIPRKDGRHIGSRIRGCTESGIGNSDASSIGDLVGVNTHSRGRGRIYVGHIESHIGSNNRCTPDHMVGGNSKSTQSYTGSVKHHSHIIGSRETYAGGDSGLHAGHNGCDKGSHIGCGMESRIKESKEVNAGISGEGLRYRHSAKNKPTLDTAIGYGSTTRRPLDTKQSGPTSPYHQQLKKIIHDEIGQLPEIQGTEMPSKSVRVPLSREESKRQLKDQLSTARKSLAKRYREELGNTSDSKDKSSQDRKSYNDNNDDDIEEPPIKKPFGDQKNIHTIDMFGTKSTKKTKILRGTNVVGFED